jgi:hypothetical protein
MTFGNDATKILTPPAIHVSGLAATLPILAGLLLCGGIALRPIAAYAQAGDNEKGTLELVDPNVFRACGDPRNLPFSNDKGEGFENKLAELFATKLAKSSVTLTSRRPPALSG